MNLPPTTMLGNILAQSIAILCHAIANHPSIGDDDAGASGEHLMPFYMVQTGGWKARAFTVIHARFPPKQSSKCRSHSHTRLRTHTSQPYIRVRVTSTNAISYIRLKSTYTYRTDTIHAQYICTALGLPRASFLSNVLFIPAKSPPAPTSVDRVPYTKTETFQPSRSKPTNIPPYNIHFAWRQNEMATDKRHFGACQTISGSMLYNIYTMVFFAEWPSMVSLSTLSFH